jgi:hypothetical protein
MPRADQDVLTADPGATAESRLLMLDLAMPAEPFAPDTVR